MQPNSRDRNESLGDLNSITSGVKAAKILTEGAQQYSRGIGEVAFEAAKPLRDEFFSSAELFSRAITLPLRHWPDFWINPYQAMSRMTAESCEISLNAALSPLRVYSAHLSQYENHAIFREAQKIIPSRWSHANEIVLDLPTFQLRFMGGQNAVDGIPLLIIPPKSGHDSKVVDFDEGQSQVETALGAGHRVYVLDWKAASAATKTENLSDLVNAVVEAREALLLHEEKLPAGPVSNTAGAIKLVGGSMGGWVATMVAALYPFVDSLGVVGSPIDAHASNGRSGVQRFVNDVNEGTFAALLQRFDGIMPGELLIAGHKLNSPERFFRREPQKLMQLIAGHAPQIEFSKVQNVLEGTKERSVLNPYEQELYEYIKFHSWFETGQAVAGTWLTEITDLHFRKNGLWKGEIVLNDLALPSDGFADLIAATAQDRSALQISCEIYSTLKSAGYLSARGIPVDCSSKTRGKIETLICEKHSMLGASVPVQIADRLISHAAGRQINLQNIKLKNLALMAASADDASHPRETLNVAGQLTNNAQRLTTILIGAVTLESLTEVLQGQVDGRKVWDFLKDVGYIDELGVPVAKPGGREFRADLDKCFGNGQRGWHESLISHLEQVRTEQFGHIDLFLSKTALNDKRFWPKLFLGLLPRKG